uniref:Uncharacterized protein n=1 Tax=Cacopsylla melanoneura TaxID=428564 RepID=A0A8D9BYJ8_9HEMI
MATSIRRFGPRQHHLYPRCPQLYLSHHRLQQSSGQNSGCETCPTRYSHWTSFRMFCLLEGSEYQRYLGSQLHISYRCQAVQRVLLTVFQIFTKSFFFVLPKARSPKQK